MSEKSVPGQVQSLPAFPLNISRLPKKGHRQSLEASERELAAIAATGNVDRVFNLTADLVVKSWHRDGVSVEGTVVADYEQSCVVTLEAMKQSLDFTFVSKHVHANSKFSRIDQTGAGEIIVDYDGDDVPEPLESDELDLWEVVLEFFNLEIDPYPRQDGVSLENNADQAQDQREISPFAVLKSLK